MGIKKSCSCGFWNQDQQECLYNGHDCFYKEIPAKKATVDMDFINKWAPQIVYLPITKTLRGQLKEMLIEAGVEVNDG